jgi:uncharacterized repeat protein (TIGR02543 family)
MKKIILSLGTALIMYIAPAQVSKTIDVATAGGFRTAFITAGGDKTITTNLTVTGNIDARDIKFMRDSMPVLAVLDLEAVQIKAYNGAGGTDLLNTIYPYSANEMPVYSFKNNQTENVTLTSIKLPSSITSIGYYAFSNCKGLTGTLNIPNSVITIENNAFDVCTGMTGTLAIPNSLTSIGLSAFESCSGLTGPLLFPGSLKSIGEGAFRYCTGFTGDLTIPNSVTTIGMGAFDNCSGFTGRLTLSNSLTAINADVFYYCGGLTGTLILPNTVTTIGNGAFYYCKGFTGDLTIPNSVTSIGEQAFNCCTGFTGKLTLPNSITKIDIMAFNDCSGLTGQLIIPGTVATIYQNAFKSCNAMTSCYIPNLVTAINSDAFGDCRGLQKIVVNISLPLGISSNNFDYTNKTTCELIVPFGSKAAYRAADVWKDFTQITEAIFVTLNTQGGNAEAPITTTQTNSTITEPDVPVRDGYSFDGWYKEAACTNAWDFATDIVTAPVTLYAKWTQDPVNITNREISGFKLYPNPATTTLHLANLPQSAQISIFNMDGKLIRQQKMAASESTIDVSILPQGIYIIRIISNDGSGQQKFVKQ